MNLRIVVEMSEAYEPSERLVAALAELDEALAEAHGDETAGFAADLVPLGTRVFGSASWQVSPAGALSRTITPPGAGASAFSDKEWFAEFRSVTPDQ